MSKKPNGIELNIENEKWINDLINIRLLTSIKGAVAILGGNSIEYEKYTRAATELARQLATAGMSVLTGGGNGIMVSANAGAFSVNKDCSYILSVNNFVKSNKNTSIYSVVSSKNIYHFNILSIRLLALICVSDAIVFFPGGFGTLDELFSLLSRIYENMMQQIPIYFYGKSFWCGILEWLKNSVVGISNIQEKSLDLINITDNINDITTQIINKIPK